MYMYINVQIPQAWPLLYEEVPHVAFCKLDRNEGIFKRPRAHSPTPTIYMPPPTNEINLDEGLYMRRSLMLPS